MMCLCVLVHEGRGGACLWGIGLGCDGDIRSPPFKINAPRIILLEKKREHTLPHVPHISCNGATKSGLLLLLHPPDGSHSRRSTPAGALGQEVSQMFASYLLTSTSSCWFQVRRPRATPSSLPCLSQGGRCSLSSTSNTSCPSDLMAPPPSASSPTSTR